MDGCSAMSDYVAHPRKTSRKSIVLPGLMPIATCFCLLREPVTFVDGDHGTIGQVKVAARPSVIIQHSRSDIRTVEHGVCAHHFAKACTAQSGVNGDKQVSHSIDGGGDVASCLPMLVALTDASTLLLLARAGDVRRDSLFVTVQSIVSD